MSPKDEDELQHMLHTAILYNGPAAVRYPRGNGEGVELSDTFRELPIGKGELLREGKDILLLPVGNRVYPALAAADGLKKIGIEAAVINPRFIKPLDEELIAEWLKKTGRLVTVEDGARRGGFGSAVLEMMVKRKLTNIKTQILGFPDRFIEHGPQDILRKKNLLDTPAIINAAMELME